MACVLALTPLSKIRTSCEVGIHILHTVPLLFTWFAYHKWLIFLCVRFCFQRRDRRWEAPSPASRSRHREIPAFVWGRDLIPKIKTRRAKKMSAAEPVAIRRNASPVTPTETWTSPNSEKHVNNMKINILSSDLWLEIDLTHLNSQINVLSKWIRHTSKVLIAVGVCEASFWT